MNDCITPVGRDKTRACAWPLHHGMQGRQALERRRCSGGLASMILLAFVLGTACAESTAENSGAAPPERIHYDQFRPLGGNLARSFDYGRDNELPGNEVLWRRPVRYVWGMTTAGEALLLSDYGGIHALDRNTGEDLWSFACGRVRTWDAAPEHVAIACDAVGLFVLEVATGAIRWQHSLPLVGSLAQLVIEGDELVATITVDRPHRAPDWLEGYQLTTGELLWERVLPLDGIVQLSLLGWYPIRDATIFLSTYSPTARLSRPLNPNSDGRRRTLEVRDTDPTMLWDPRPPIPVDDGFVSHDENSIEAWDAEGNKRTLFKSGACDLNKDIAVDERNVYFTGCATLAAVARDTGELLWSWSPPWVDFSYPQLIAEQQLEPPARGRPKKAGLTNRLRACQRDSKSGCFHAPIVAGEWVFVQSKDGQVWAVDRSTGALVREYRATDRGVHPGDAPPVVSEGALYVEVGDELVAFR